MLCDTGAPILYLHLSSQCGYYVMKNAMLHALLLLENSYDL
jgi:hypothetical protein